VLGSFALANAPDFFNDGVLRLELFYPHLFLAQSQVTKTDAGNTFP
jgi:hypothetical protein